MSCNPKREMLIDNYYATMGLTHDATAREIKSTYKALALVHHPDKTVNLRASERAQHGARFRAVQEAYDVLNNPNQKAVYDRELEKYGNKVYSQYTTFHTNSARTQTGVHMEDAHPKPTRTFPITTPEMKIAIKAQLDQQLWKIKEDRAKRDAEDATMDLAGLEYTLHIWRKMAEEPDLDAAARAHCQIKAYEYNEKLQARKAEILGCLHEACVSQDAELPKNSSIPNDYSRLSTRWKAPRFPTAKAESRRHTKEELVQEQVRRAESRLAEKVRRDAYKQAKQEAKAANVRAQKEILKQRKYEASARDAERIARARAKVAGTLKVDLDIDATPETGDGASTDAPKRSIRVICKCGVRHASVREWKRCSMTGKEESDDASFFNNS